MKWLRKHLAYALAAILVAVGVFAAGGVINGFADETATSAPTVEKTLTPNGDGTYKLSLSVTGTASSESSSSKANVVIVFDTSGSMNEDTGQYTYTPTDETYNTYGLVERKYVALSYHRGGLFSAGYWTVGRNGARYTGQRYVRTGGTRMEVAQSATTNLIDQLLANNTDENPDAVEISLVNFATDVKANGTTSWGNNDTNAAYLDGVVKGYTANGGTNWEAALAQAETLVNQKKNSETEADEATYVIFVSDGDPTFRTSQYADNANDYYNLRDEGVWGTGNSDPNKWNFSAAKAVMDRLLNTSTVYAIGAFGNADNMQNIGGKYIRADNEADLKAAFADILNQITNAVGFKNVSMTDNVTGLTASTLVDGQASGFTYTKDGQPWTGAPAASFKGGKVSWDLTSAGTLEKGAKYTVSFDVWPSQKSLDLLADLNNGTKKYDDLTAEEKAQIVAVDGGGYGLNTNTDSGNSVAYTQVETKTVNKESLKEDGYKWVDNGDGTWTGTKETAGTPINFTNPKPMPLTSSSMTIQKVFENSLHDTSADSINLMVKSDGNDYLSETLTSAESWTKTLSIAPGIIKGNEVLEGGHDYTVTEPGDYHWDLTAPVYHPMIIDGTLTMLQEDANGSYTIAGKKYSAIEGTTTLTATNSRRSVINLTKVVDDKTNGSAPTDAAFTYTGTVKDPTGAQVWFSVMDAKGNLVKELSTSATAEEKDGAKTGYYHVASGTEFTVDLQADQNLRIVNAPKGMTYSFTEDADMPKGFSFEKAEGDDLPDQTVSGTVTASNTKYAAKFTNSYDKVTLVSGTEDGLKATKAVTGHDATEAFNFDLSAADNDTKAAVESGDIVMAGTTATTSDAMKDGTTETVNFGDVTFYAEGTYKFTIDETTTTKAGGWTYDAATHDVTVKVTKVDGKLVATVADNNPTFTNEYKADTTIETKAEDNAFLTKTVTADGTAWAPKTFEFQISAAEGTPMPEKATGSATFDAAGSQVIDFGKVTYTKPGTYTYTVKETTTGENDGWTYDNAEKTVSVNVVDNNDGTLTAKVSGVTITNVYGANGKLDSAATAVLTKTVVADGTAWAPKTFEFKVTPEDGAPAPEKATGSATFSAAGSQTVSFGKFSFTKAGTYKYKVQETTASGAGWTCDNAEHEAIITVKDNGDGTLTATVTTPASITNEYKPTTTIDSKAEGSAFLTKTVVADGTAWAPKTFEFSITQAEGSPAPESATGSATFSAAGTQVVSFGKFNFTKAGTYTYTVKETTESGAGWTCDNAEHEVVITVKDNGNGTLTAAVTTPASITNTYGDFQPLTVADPPVSKVVEGDPAVMPTFEFTMSAAEGAPMPEGSANGAKTVALQGAGSVEFGDITFTKPGTYTYTVAETKGGADGWTNDTQTYTVVYTVTDNGDGTMSAAMTVNGAADGKAIFTNSYAAKGELDTTATAVLTKTVESKVDDTAWAPKTFDFTITPAKGNPADVTIENAKGSATFQAAGTQTISFGKIAFTKAGTYNFSVAETTQSGNGWTCDTTAKNVEVKVTDKGDGTLVAAVKAPADIKNVYDVKPIGGDDAVKLSVTKTLEGNTLAAGQFSFELKDAQGNLLQTKSNAADGTVAFDGLVYTKPGTYEYTISEVNDEKAGYKYDGDSATVTVTVTDKGDGTMSAEAKYGKTTFSNSYAASGNTGTTIFAQKTLEGRQLADGQFKFELKDSDDNVLQTKTNDASGRVVFDAIEYDQSIFGEAAPETDEPKAEEPTTEPAAEEPKADEPKAEEPAAEPEAPKAEEPAAEPEAAKVEGTDTEAETTEVANPVAELTDALASLISTTANAADNPRTKVFTYKISEVNDGKDGYEYDGHVETVTVTVTDKGDGTLAVSTAYDEDGATFANKYTATGETGSSVTATKTLTGRDMVEGEFEFALLDAAGNEVATGKNAADGSVTFSSIKYTQDEVGEHEYTMVEKSGSKTGVTYDTAKKPVKVTVTDNGNGTLATAVSYPEGNTFENTYKPLATSGYLTAQKVLNGRELQAGEFSFELLDADGNVIDTQSNAADGTVKFEGLNFDEAGTFTYQVREVKGDEANVTYDEKVATYTVVVEDVDGQLTITSVTADGSDQAAVFTNTYTEPPAPTPEPEQPRRPLPNSGDATPDATPLAMIGLAVLAGGVLLRKRELGK